ncbi:MAG: 3-hydroxyacyl-CoA dehydrogenase, partial [Paeniglutamicibacter terrestris]
MSSSTIENFASLAAMVPDEIITHSLIEDVRLPSGATIALLTLDNGFDHSKPTTLGPNTLLELHATLTEQKKRAAAGEIQALALTGKP